VKTRLNGAAVVLGLLAAAAGMLAGSGAIGHIVPPEKLHPVAESYRRMMFALNLNPVPWDLVESDARVIGEQLGQVDADRATAYRKAVDEDLAAARRASAGDSLDPALRKATAARIYERSTVAVARALGARLERAGSALGDYGVSSRELEGARGIWASFEHEVKYSDPRAFRDLGRCWLIMAGALGSPGVLGTGRSEPDRKAFQEEADEVAAYVRENYGDGYTAGGSWLSPLPRHSRTFDPAAHVPAKLPPGADMNKQLPRPRQVLNMASRGVDESETILIALGDMAFDSNFLFGEPARSLGVSCNTCHNKGVTNPDFVVPGISARAGGLDVSSSFFAPHANNGHLDPVDIPDLRGIRFTGPYGRNGRIASLREFVRNVIVNEFNGPEPDPLILDGMVTYMLEFDFLPNPYLNADGTLGAKAPDAAKRGERLFHQPMAGMGGRACATCHVPSDHFLDHRQHDIGTAQGSGEGSLDRALDTPTLLSARYTAPYFHDGRAPSLRAVVEWFDARYGLGLTRQQQDDLTSYLETVGSGEEPYEDTVFTLEAEMEEFSFFLSTYEFLRDRKLPDANELTFLTVASEIRAHKWDVQDDRHLGVLDSLAALMDRAHAASRRGDARAVDGLVAEYRSLYEKNAEVLK
jgi:cytochrome c peroxidase